MQKTNKLPNYIKLNDAVRPQDDFYAYVCQHWRQANPLPETEACWATFDALRDEVDKQIEIIINDWLNPKTSLTPPQKQVVTYYQALVNKDKNQPQSQQSLQKIQAEIRQTAQERDAEILGKLGKWKIWGFLKLGADIDNKNSRRFLLSVKPPNLDLPNRDYYLSDNKHMQESRQAYLDFLEAHRSMLKEHGLGSQLKPEEILEIETALAELTWPISKARDKEKTYNLYSWTELCKDFNFDWPTYLRHAGIDAVQEVVVSQPSYLKGALKHLKQLTPDKLREYLLHKFLLDFSSLLNEKIATVRFDFFGKHLSGKQQLKPLNERAVLSVNSQFSDIIGQAYVKRHFPVSHKKAVQALAQQVCESFQRRLERNTWMTAASRQLAQEKLKNIIVNIGYSGSWLEYENIKLETDDPVANDLHATSMNRTQAFGLLKQCPDRYSLGVLSDRAQRVGAWTYPALLNTNYPAAILQPPFYDYEAGLAYNLGSLGSIIGHELTHSFDDQGSKYDKEGNINPWLNEKEQQAFKKAANKLIDKANEHYPVPTVKMKGEQVIGEAIADLGGLEIVVDAIKNEYQDNEERGKALRNMFIAHAFTFASNASSQFLIKQAKTDVHPNGYFRINGILPHCDAFYEAFNVKKGDAMYLDPKERARIW